MIRKVKYKEFQRYIQVEVELVEEVALWTQKDQQPLQLYVQILPLLSSFCESRHNCQPSQQ